ncbi:carboxypeptidase-like regulatory domain-containing protein [Flavobacterium suzhouense]|uniref:Carboxypeptidase-like regulatory domain-containing protein n=1 Tax=Flavobacterium suzhouense TaxID=1529638 RepID=A0ABW5NXS1_9FLAO
MKRFILILLFILFAVNNQAQSSSNSTTITGIVINDYSNTIISGAKIKDMITGKETFTDSLGGFSIEAAGNYIEISAEGFDTKYYTKPYQNNRIFYLFDKVRHKQQQKKIKHFPITITGIVCDEIGLPIPGVSIHAKKNKQSFITDFDGKFTITIDKRDKISFSFVGLKGVIINIKAPMPRFYKIILEDESRIWI